MRERKQRAFYMGKMIYGVARLGNALHWGDGNFDAFAFCGDNPAILMDWTGKIDCDGNDIYEGDRIKHDSNHGKYIGVVKFKLGYHLSGFRIVWDGMSCTPRMNKCKVIGNVNEVGE